MTLSLNAQRNDGLELARLSAALLDTEHCCLSSAERERDQLKKQQKKTFVKYISYAFVEHERTLQYHAIIVYELPFTTNDVKTVSVALANAQ